MSQSSPYHEGEIAVQRLAGVSHIAARTGAVIGDEIPFRAAPFLADRRLLVTGSVDAAGIPWASAIVGDPGMLRAGADGRTLAIDLRRVRRDPADPLWSNLEADGRIGTVAMDFARRRRFRVNGRVGIRTADRLVIDVDEAYGNCPQHISRREIDQLGDVAGVASDLDLAPRRSELDADDRAMIAAADTMFVATVRPGGGVDASHRGGPVGFVSVQADGSIRIPDYSGNAMFNTLGNIHAHPYAGLLFIDFERGRTLQVVGDASLDFADTGEPAREGERTWTVRPRAVIRRASPFNVAWIAIA